MHFGSCIMSHLGFLPIYLQIVNQVKRAVASGVLVPGDRLPTVRQLAVDLTINPNTVAKAYQELEREGVISTVPGRGTFVGQKKNSPKPKGLFFSHLTS